MTALTITLFPKDSGQRGVEDDEKGYSSRIPKSSIS